MRYCIGFLDMCVGDMFTAEEARDEAVRIFLTYGYVVDYVAAYIHRGDNLGKIFLN